MLNFINREVNIFRLFNKENDSIKVINRNLLETTRRYFYSLNTTELEIRHDRAFTMLEKLYLESKEFDEE